MSHFSALNKLTSRGNLMFDKIKREFFRAVTISILLYACTSAYQRKAWRKTRCKIPKNAMSYFEQILESTPLISHFILVRRTRQAWHCSKSKDKIKSEDLHFQLYANTGWRLEDFQDQWSIRTGGERQRQRESRESGLSTRLDDDDDDDDDDDVLCMKFTYKYKNDYVTYLI